jgi:DNA-binding response OmpR family regulator
MNKVAIIEDNQPIREMYDMKLKSSGYEVHTASNGQEGIELLEKIRPDLVLLDIRMPIMNGDEMLAKLRETDWGSLLKVIILTNLSKDEAPSILKFLNVERYIVKAHYTPSQVLNIIDEVFNNMYKKHK